MLLWIEISETIRQNEFFPWVASVRYLDTMNKVMNMKKYKEAVASSADSSYAWWVSHTCVPELPRSVIVTQGYEMKYKG